MGRYANQTVTLNFPDLTIEGEPTIFVTIKNPKVLPLDQLVPDEAKPAAAGAETDPAAVEDSTYAMMARLVRDWHVYDATIDDDNAPPLPLPATADMMRALPFEIVKEITEKVTEVTANPQ